jgi:flagellar motility protein MotE (MotC chaperone)
MKMFSSGWVLAILAALLNIGTTCGLIFLEKDAIFHPKAAEGEAKYGPPRFWSFRADEVEALISELNDQRAKLVDRQTELDKLASHIDAERQELEKTRADIGAMRDQISAELPEVKDAERKNLKNLAQTYAIITPTAAVAIFREMDENTCAKLLSQMKPEKVGAILQEMSQEDKDESMTKRAARISDKLRLMLDQTKPQS